MAASASAVRTSAYSDATAPRALRSTSGPAGGEAAIASADVIVILGVDLSHGRLLRPLFVGMRDQARQPRDEKDRVAQLVGKPQVGADRGDRAVDVHGQQPI